MVMRDMILDLHDRGGLKTVYFLWNFTEHNLQKKS